MGTLECLKYRAWPVSLVTRLYHWCSSMGNTLEGKGYIESTAWVMPVAIFKHAIPFLKHTLKPDIVSCPTVPGIPSSSLSTQILILSLLLCLIWKVCWSQKRPGVSHSSWPWDLQWFPSVLKCWPHCHQNWCHRYSLQYLFSPAKTHPRDGLIHSNAKQALQHAPGRALSLKRCRLEM